MLRGLRAQGSGLRAQDPGPRANEVWWDEPIIASLGAVIGSSFRPVDLEGRMELAESGVAPHSKGALRHQALLREALWSAARIAALFGWRRYSLEQVGRHE